MLLQNVVEEDWSHIPSLAIEGDPTAGPDINTWLNAAVLRVSPGGTPFTIAFRRGDCFQRLRIPAAPRNGLFALRLGPNDVELYIISRYTNSELVPKLVEIAPIDSPEHEEVPLY